MTTPMAATTTVVRASTASIRRASGRPVDGRWGERVLTKGLRPTRIPVVSPAATSPLVSTSGWLYDLLTWIGVDHTTARPLQQVVVKPVTVVLVLAVAAVVGWFGSRIIRR